MKENEGNDLASKWRKTGHDGIIADQNLENSSASGERKSGPSQITPDYDRLPAGEFSSAYGDEEAQAGIGRDLAAVFKQQGIHPILIFGSKSSGKTMLLTSLFKYFHQDTAKNVDGTLYPYFDAFKESAGVHNQILDDHARLARYFYDKIVQQVMDGNAAAATQHAIPFFIPVELRMTNGATARFAFLEGKGEWYQPDDTPGSEVSIKQFKGVIRGIIQEFSESLSIVLVAPCIPGGYIDGSIDSTSSDISLRGSDRGLSGAMDEYTKLRDKKRGLDHLLFLVSKWDVECGGVTGEEFYSPDQESLRSVIADRFPLAWARFNNQNENLMQSRNFAAYCSGKIDGNRLVNLANDDAALVSRYPRRIWNWIFMNSTGSVLYPDMLPPKFGIFDRFIRLVRGE